MIDVKLKADGTIKYLTQAQKDMKKLKSDVYKLWAVQINSDIAKQFQTEGAYLLGGKWKSLSPKTLAKRGNDAMILQDKGILKKGTRAISGSSSVKVGFLKNAIYGMKHQEGIGLPKREIIVINRETEKKLLNIAQKLANKVFNK